MRIPTERNILARAGKNHCFETNVHDGRVQLEMWPWMRSRSSGGNTAPMMVEKVDFGAMNVDRHPQTAKLYNEIPEGNALKLERLT